MRFSQTLEKTSGARPGEMVTRKTAMDFSAMAGYLPNPDEVLRKIGKEQTVFKEIKTDAHLSACELSRKAGVLSQMWDVDKAAPGKAVKRSPASEAFASNLAKLDIDRIMGEILNYYLTGFQPLEVIWEQVGGMWWIKDVVGKPPEWFLFGAENDLRFSGANASTIAGEPVPERKFLLPRQNATFQNPYGDAQYSKCYWPVTFKKANVKFWITFAEKYGQPFAVGKLPRNATEADYDEFLEDLTSMIQDCATVVPDDGSVEIMEANRATSSELYRDLIKWANSEISKAILGHDGSTDSTPGKLGGDNTALTVRDEIVMMDKRQIEAQFNILSKWFTDINFGGDQFPRFQLYSEEDVDKALAERDNLLSQQGVRFNAEYYSSAYNLDPAHFTVSEPQPQQPQGGNPFQFSAASDGQKAITAGRDEVADTMQAQARDMVQPIIDMVGRAKNYNEAREMLLKLYPEMDSGKAEKALQRAMFIASIAGRAAANA